MALDIGKLEDRTLKIQTGNWVTRGITVRGVASKVIEAIFLLKLSGTLLVLVDSAGCCGDDEFEVVAEVEAGEIFDVKPSFDDIKGEPLQKVQRSHKIRNSRRSRETIPDGAGRRVAKQKAALGDRRYGKFLIGEAMAELH